MQMHLTATELELTAPLKVYVERRLKFANKLLKRFERDGEIALYVEVARTTRHHHKGEGVYYAEATAVVDGETVRAEAHAEDARKAIDELRDILKREFRALKERRTGKRRGIRALKRWR